MQTESDFRDFTIAIIGLGLMGGSLALAIKRSTAATIIGVDNRQVAVQRALEKKAIDRSVDFGLATREADLIVLATPVSTILKMLEEQAEEFQQDTIVFDLGSTKQEILAAMEKLPEGVEPIGGHPMCGKELSGMLAADPDLYDGAIFPLVPLERTSQATVELLQNLIQRIGATPLLLDAQRHDRLVGAISHLPYLVSVSLIMSAADIASEDSLAWSLAASGLRDTSRLAGSNIQMMRDIILTNRENISEMLHRFQGYWDQLTELVESGTEEELTQTLTRAYQDRHGLSP